MFLVLLSYECSPELKTNLCFAIHELCWPFALGTQPPYFIHPSTLAFYTRSQYSSIPSVNPPRDFFLLFGQLTKRGVHRPDILTQRPLPIIQCFFFKQKTAYEILSGLVGSEMCIRDRLYTPFYTRLLHSIPIFLHSFGQSST